MPEAFSQSFEKNFGSANNDIIRSMKLTNDKGMIVCGDDNGIRLTKFDSTGNLNWSKAYPMIAPGMRNPVVHLKNSGYALCGQGQGMGLIMALNPNGNVLWGKYYSLVNSFTSIKQTFDKGYIIAGGRVISSESIIMKTDSNGTIIWTYLIKNSNSINDLHINDIIELPSDSGLIATFRHNPPPGTQEFITFLKLSKSGNLIWQRKINTPNLQIFGNLHLMENEDVLLASPFFGFVKLDKSGLNGELIGASPLSMSNYVIRDVLPSKRFKKGFLVLGTGGTTVSDFILSEIDSLANVIWAKHIGGANFEYAMNFYQTSSKNIIISGLTKSFSSGNNDYYLVKTDSLGNTCNSDTIALVNMSNTPFTTSALTSTLSPFVAGVITNTVFVESTNTFTLQNPCVCQPPMASFSVNSSGFVTDKSLWANKWYWWFSTGAIDTININGSTNTFSVNGTYTVCLKVTNNCGSDSTCVPFTYIQPGPISVSELSENSFLQLFPNPAIDYLTILLNNPYTEFTDYYFYNTLGEKVLNVKLKNGENIVNLTELRQGVYYLRGENKNSVLVKKVIKN